MKKLAIILAMSSLVALTACQKEVKEVEKGSKVELKAQGLSINSVTDIQEDMNKIQTLALSQEAKAGDLDQRLDAAIQSDDTETIKKLFPEVKIAMSENLAALRSLPLKSKEVTELRQKLMQITNLSLNLQEKMFTGQPKPEELQKLQEEGAQIQQEIMLISQKIHMITSGGQAETAQAPMTEDEIRQALTEQIANASQEDAAPATPQPVAQSQQ